MKLRRLGPVGLLAVVSAIEGALAAQIRMNPSFEVASVKPNKSGSMNARISMPTDRFEATSPD